MKAKKYFHIKKTDGVIYTLPFSINLNGSV